MEVDPMEPVNDAVQDEESRGGHTTSHLSARVAVTVALLATFLGVCKVKDDNIVQAMQQAQAAKIDDWNFYQARNIREEVARAALTELTLAADVAPASQAGRYADALKTYTALVAEQGQKKEALRAQAVQDQATYDGLNYRDDQFDLADAMLAIAISLLAITALTHKDWLYWLAMAPTAGGVLMGLAGLLGWHLHPDALAKLLG